MNVKDNIQILCGKQPHDVYKKVIFVASVIY